jgi:von Willebrand factor type A domain
MRRPNRAISILSMSALDVLAMATGVFILLLVMLMPYYRRTFDANAEIEAARVAAAASLAEVQSLEATAARHQAEAGAAAAEAAELNARAAALEHAASRRVAPQAALNQGPDAGQQVIEAIDLVFVVDTTASMTPVIRELAISIRSIVRILQRLVPSVRIGISAYKDRDTGLPPVITFPLTPTDPYLPRIVGFLESLEASPIGSRTIEEDVHLGLEAASLMSWRADARQVLVVIGDAAAHPEYQDETFWRARNFVQGNELRSFSTLFVTTPSSLSAGQRARPYFQALARAGDGTFNDHTGSMTESVLLSVLVD